MTKYEPVRGKYRKPGIGYVKQLSANCWQGGYTATIDGKRRVLCVYDKTEALAEKKLA